MKNVLPEMAHLYQPGVGIPITRANVAALNGILKRPATAADVIRAFRPAYMVRHDLGGDDPTTVSRHRMRAVKTVLSLSRKAM